MEKDDLKSKICKACLKEKPISQFYHNTNCKDGYEGRCKICRNTRIRVRREPKSKKMALAGDLKMRGVSKSDYCGMWHFLEKMGYDLSQDIHLQFCEKHGLKPKKRPTKQESKYLHTDC